MIWCLLLTYVVLPHLISSFTCVFCAYLEDKFSFVFCVLLQESQVWIDRQCGTLYYTLVIYFRIWRNNFTGRTRQLFSLYTKLSLLFIPKCGSIYWTFFGSDSLFGSSCQYPWLLNRNIKLKAQTKWAPKNKRPYADNEEPSHSHQILELKGSCPHFKEHCGVWHGCLDPKIAISFVISQYCSI